MFVDLHIHSYFSDGAQTPEQAALACRDSGVGLAALCDQASEAHGPGVGLSGAGGGDLRHDHPVDAGVVWRRGHAFAGGRPGRAAAA